MCFSASASFIGGAVITAIGIATIRKVHNPKQIVFASIPFFFGVQQIFEGFLWMSIQHPSFAIMHNFSTYGFLLMAQVIWPIFIPVAMLMMEKEKKLRIIMWAMFFLGSIVTVYYSICLIFLNVSPKIIGYHIQYDNDFPEKFAMIIFILYLLATITPLMISSLKRTHWLGAFMFLSCVVTAIFFTQYLISVWCFFAALISGVIYWILSDSKKKFNFDKLLAKKNEITMLFSSK